MPAGRTLHGTGSFLPRFKREEKITELCSLAISRDYFPSCISSDVNLSSHWLPEVDLQKASCRHAD
jgi:hypothetical protein